ncbi:Rrf2 family transcriptional regulator [Defluviimonas sp. WL0024]|uniref:Rrf2 family transcriptional regulator n=2 Tax=Albidovulum TaxID=205889 RepID=A0ABT3J9M3_9RHOB|nr:MULTISPECIES: Rrf2 family transcriptional regulator [Defluviimonas]MCU9850442.1 Rrf2 family transcriptional regulator [Defluviimonas sp. WL0024]MCW3784394.1 Rrf2 family transcriptional regulator [Defluviimonas salinarum]
MRLTAFTDYGLRALMRMASEPDRAFSTAELADFFAVSRHHLTKIMATLATQGIVVTRRGAGGGAMLARPAPEIRLGDVVRILEQGQALVECFAPEGGNCTIRGCCRLRVRLRAAEEAFLAALNRSTLADCALPPDSVPALSEASGRGWPD